MNKQLLTLAERISKLKPWQLAAISDGEDWPTILREAVNRHGIDDAIHIAKGCLAYEAERPSNSGDYLAGIRLVLRSLEAWNRNPSEDGDIILQYARLGALQELSEQSQELGLYGDQNHE